MIRLAIGWATMFVVGTDLFVVSPLLPLIAVDYQISPSLARLSVTVFSLTYMVSAPLLGHVADRIGRRRTLTCCLLAFAAANLATASAGSFVWLLAARLISGQRQRACHQRSMRWSVSPLHWIDVLLGWRWSRRDC